MLECAGVRSTLDATLRFGAWVRERPGPPGVPGRAPAPRLLDRIREEIRVRHYSRRTEKAYVDWARRYVLLHGKPDCCRLRVNDVDPEQGEIVVRDAKGARDRMTMLPARLVPTLAAQIESVRAQHARDLAQGLGSVDLSLALERKSPGPPSSSPGSKYSRPRGSTRTRHAAAAVGTICTSLSSSAPCGRRGARPASRWRPPATLSATRSPPIRSRTATTSGLRCNPRPRTSHYALGHYAHA